jgi:hypothetical protein
VRKFGAPDAAQGRVTVVGCLVAEVNAKTVGIDLAAALNVSDHIVSLVGFTRSVAFLA